MIKFFLNLKNKKQNHVIKDVDLFDENFYQNYFKYYPRFHKNKSVLFFKKSNCYGVFDFKLVKEVLQDKEFYSSENFKEDDKILLGADGINHASAKKAVTKNLNFLRESENDNTILILNKILDQLIQHALKKNENVNVIDLIVNPLVLNLIMIKYGLLSHYPSLDILSKEGELEDKINNIQKIFQDRGILGDISKESFKQKKMSQELLNLMSEFHQNSFQDEDLIKFMNVFLQAGVLTTSSLIASCIKNLDKLDEEKIKDGNQIDLFINEVLRLYSPSQFVFRRVIKNVFIDNIEIPKGSLMAVSIGAANRDEKIFRNSLFFDLNRTEKHIAFGISTHKCIGEKIVFTITKAFIIKFYKEYFKANNLTIDKNVTFDNTIFIYKINKLVLKKNTIL